jgi:hypothetical protein
MQGVFTLFTPVVQVGLVFLTNDDLFEGDELRKERLKDVIEEEGRA